MVIIRPTGERGNHGALIASTTENVIPGLSYLIDARKSRLDRGIRN